MTRSYPCYRPAGRAFSIVELLVVIAIIAVLVGILLVALSTVQDTAKETKTLSTMRAFANACEEFQLEIGRYPGVIPEAVLAFHESSPFSAAGSISGMENALLELLGGYRVQNPFSSAKEVDDYVSFKDAAMNAGSPFVEITFLGSAGEPWNLFVDLNKIGEGPVISGKPYAPFLTLDDNALRPAYGQTLEAASPLPDLIDGWGQPILYLRQARKNGEMVGDSSSSSPTQFLFAGLAPYLQADLLGDLEADQTRAGSISTENYSILDIAEVGADTANANLAQILRNPALGDAEEPQAEGSPRGAIYLISAGPDGVFFSATDGPGTPNAPVTDISTSSSPTPDFVTPRVVKEYDDMILAAGG